MQLESLTCNNCGAPLEVAESTNFVTCAHCQTRLAIRRTDSSAFTEQLEDIGAKQDLLIQRLHRIERQNKIAELDRAWETEKKKLGFSGEQGIPVVSAIFTGCFLVAVIIVGIIWIAIAGYIYPPMAFFGFLFIAAAIYGGVNTCSKAVAYEKALQRYQQEKRRLRASVKDDDMSD